MLTSFPENIPNIIYAIANIYPKSILDIGFGYGKYWLLARETIYSLRADKWDLTPKDDLIVNGVEIAKYFLDMPYGKVIYNKTFDDLSKVTGSYDLALLIDVIEHWDKDFTMKTLTELKKYVKTILISTPKSVVFYEPEYYWKDCPKHQTQWTINDFSSFNIVDMSTDLSYLFLING